MHNTSGMMKIMRKLNKKAEMDATWPYIIGAIIALAALLIILFITGAGRNALNGILDLFRGI